jgi:hypothetical protein
MNELYVSICVVYVSVKIIIKKLELFEVLLSEGNKGSCKVKIWSHRTADSENFFVAALQQDAIFLKIY